MLQFKFSTSHSNHRLLFVAGAFATHVTNVVMPLLSQLGFNRLSNVSIDSIASSLEDLLVLTSTNGFEVHIHKQFDKNQAIPIVYMANYDRFVMSKQV